MSKGVDIPIDRLRAVYKSDLWASIATAKKAYYGRVFRNERFADFSVSVSPEVHAGIGKDKYHEVLKDTNLYAQCFFDRQPDIAIDGTIATAIVWNPFMVNLQEIHPLLSREEATEQVHEDVRSIIQTMGFTITGMVTGFNAVSSYDWANERMNQPRADMSPHYAFRYDLEIEYSINNC